MGSGLGLGRKGGRNCGSEGAREKEVSDGKVDRWK